MEKCLTLHRKVQFLVDKDMLVGMLVVVLVGHSEATAAAKVVKVGGPTVELPVEPVAPGATVAVVGMVVTKHRTAGLVLVVGEVGPAAGTTPGQVVVVE